MDRDQATGLILIALLVIVYFTFFQPEPQQLEEVKQETVVENQAEETKTTPATTIEAPTNLNDSAKNAFLTQRYGIFAEAAAGEAKEYTLENEDIRVTFNSKGATINTVLLKDYKTYDQEPLYLVTPDDNKIELLANTPYGSINLMDLYYQTSQEEVKNEEGQVIGKKLIFSANLAEGKKIIQTYTLLNDSYQVGYDIKTSGLASTFKNNALTFQWNKRMLNLERDLQDSRTRSTVNFYTAEDEYDELDKITSGSDETTVSNPVKWAGINHRFFTAAIVAEDFFSSGSFSTVVPEADLKVLKDAKINLTIPVASLEDKGASFRYFFGPNNYAVLNDVAEDFGKNVNLGYFILRPINKYLIIPVFHFLEDYITNYGIIILILVLFIKLLLFPLSYKSYISMAKTRVLKPQLDEIKEKYGDDMQKIQQEQMKLYSQLGINPISGCVPMLLQMPILFAMFYFFPNSIELRQESFLWAEDLSTYDSIMKLPFTIPAYGDHVSLFCLLMTASTILYTWSNQQMTSVQGPMKTFSYLMPVVFLFFLNSFPAGLTFYYFVSNIITFGQQAIIRRFVDDKKVMEIIERNKLKNKDKKKSKFQQRLEDALKASEEAKKSTEQERQAKKSKRK